MTAGAQGTTLKDILDAGAGYLAQRGVDQPRLACEWLAARLLNCRRLDLALRFDSRLTDTQRDAMRRGVKRVGDGEPVQYVTGRMGFLDHVFIVDRRALIPRPETEQLVLRVLETEALWAVEHPVVADLGTGCGCIAVSLALARPAGVYLALDPSQDALALARENAARLGVTQRIGFSEREIPDLIEPESLDAIVANLPYIPSAEVDRLPRHIRDHEPRMALDGGPDGLAVMTAAAQDAAMALKPGGHLFLEIGQGQADRVRVLLGEAGFGEIAVTPDLAGIERVVRARVIAV
jgi:release factor glutamine methyltransferase